MTAGKLRVLVIDDEDQGEFIKAHRHLMDFDPLRHPDSGHGLMLKNQGEGTSYDLILCDVNFAGSSVAQAFNPKLRQKDSIAPLGPLLALPFLWSDDVVFVPYSNYWQDSHLRDDIALMTALGIIEAHVLSREVAFGEVFNSLGALVDDLNPRGNAVQALPVALEKFRQRLLRRPHDFRGAGALLERLNQTDPKEPPAFFRQALAPKIRIDLSEEGPVGQFEGGEEPDGFYVHLSRRNGKERSISMATLYADFLDADLDTTSLTGLNSLTKRWANARQEMIGDLAMVINETGADVGDIAIAAARILAETDSEVEDRPYLRIDHAMQTLPWRDWVRGLELGDMLRAAVLCAWVKAWHAYRDTVEERRIAVKTSARLALGLRESRDVPNPTVTYGRLFAHDRGPLKLDNRGLVSWSAPFDASASGAFRWSLEQDRRADLSARDRDICREFAALPWEQGGLSWRSSSPTLPMPLWMLD